MVDNFVYHSSKTSGLTKLSPKPSTHKMPWVYATKNIATSALFLGDNFDFICQTGISGNIPYVYEQFEGALNLAYKGYKGSIYKLDGAKFLSGQTGWSAEVVCTEEVPVVEEVLVEDALTYILNLEKEGKVKIYMYPDKPASAPKDKSDIIERAVQWTLDFGDSTLEQVKKYHPDVLPEVTSRLEKLNYKLQNKSTL